MAYETLDPTKVHFGKTYSSFVEEWFNWFLTTDADKRTSGQVVFLRSAGIPYSIMEDNGSGSGKDQSISSTYAEDPYFPRRYKNDPNVRVGRDKLQICSNQAVLVPIITAYSEASKPYADYGLMQDYCGLTIDYGSNPPDVSQLTINGLPIALPRGREMRDFRVATSVFTAVVPEADYGRSIKDFLEMDLPSGHYPAIVEGYFVLIKFTEPGTYVVYSYASAPRELRGGSYFSELLYEIQVNECEEKQSIGHPGFKPERSASIIKRILKEKLISGELLPDEVRSVLTKAKIMSDGDADKFLG
jgi:hypothetical protein